MNLLAKYVKADYKSYEDFYENFKINIPENFNYGFDIIDQIANECPNQRALVWRNDKGQSKDFSFKEISSLSNKAANAFIKLGLKKGDTVMLIVKRRYQFWYLMVALHKLGIVAVPSTHLLTEKDIDYRIKSADIKMIISVADKIVEKHINDAISENFNVKLCSIDGKMNGFTDLDELIEQSNDETPERTTVNNDPMLIYFTSGTTAHPKMVEHISTYPLGHILTAGFWQNLKDTDVHFTMSDTGWAKCAWGKLYGQWICGAAIFVYDYDGAFTPVDILNVIQTNKMTTFCAPPTIYRFLIKEELNKYDLSSLRACYIAGEPLNAEVYKQWLDKTGLELREGFGQTETPVLLAVFPWITPKPGSTGKPSPHLNIHLLDEKGNECGVGDEGEVCIDIKKGIPAGIIQQYRNEPLANAEAMKNGYYHTGDMAWRDEDGYFWFIGRGDDVIKSSGYRIGPFEVESALLEHPAVLESAITAVPDLERGQIVKATVVLAKGYSASDELKKELQNHVKRTTAPYKYPRIIEFVEELPKTISGKTKRKQIRIEDQK